LSSRWLRLPKIWVSNDMLEFLKNTPQKEPGEVWLLHPSSTAMAQNHGF
jgi:hypothetical protein